MDFRKIETVYPIRIAYVIWIGVSAVITVLVGAFALKETATFL